MAKGDEEIHWIVEEIHKQIEFVDMGYLHYLIEQDHLYVIIAWNSHKTQTINVGLDYPIDHQSVSHAFNRKVVAFNIFYGDGSIDISEKSINIGERVKLSDASINLFRVMLRMLMV